MAVLAEIARRAGQAGIDCARMRRLRFTRNTSWYERPKWIARLLILLHSISPASQKHRLDGHIFVVCRCILYRLTAAKRQHIVVPTLSPWHVHMTRTAPGANGNEGQEAPYRPS